MKIIQSINEIKDISSYNLKKGLQTGFVPTMGFLHSGHISLINKSVTENDISIVSIFVNPAQFGPNEDYKTYPRDLSLDADKCKKNNVDYIFAPDNNDIYPKNYLTYVNVGKVSDVFEGAFRPGHFNGVCTIVLKLLNIIHPTIMYLGQKDAQQAFIIKKMISDLNISTKLSIQPTVRDENGLALSSRNEYLNKEQYNIALNLSNSLFSILKLFKNGETDKKKIIDNVKDKYLYNDRITLDYIDIVDADTFSKVDKVFKKNIAIIAAKVDNIRLIDNVII